MRKDKKRRLALVLAVGMLTAMFVGGTVAYFTDTKSVTDKFTSGDIKIELKETKVEEIKDAYGNNKWILDSNEEKTDKGNTYNLVYPGATLPKDPTVTNVGINAAYVRMKVTIDNWDKWKVALGLDDSDLDDDTFTQLVFDELNSEFTQIGGGKLSDDKTSVTFVYNYDEVLDAKDKADGHFTTPALFEAITIPVEITEEHTDALAGSIEIVAEAIQAIEGSSMTSMWNAFEVQN